MGLDFELVLLVGAACVGAVLLALAGRAVWQRAGAARGRAVLLARRFWRALLTTLLLGLALGLAAAFAAAPLIRQVLGIGLVASLIGLAWQTLALRRTATGERSATALAKPSLLSDYVGLTKPKVISLLLVTTLAAMFITPEGQPSLALVFWTMLGGYLAAGGAGAINCAFDGDIDNLMGRTSRRPVPSGRISQRDALIFGIVLNVLAFAVLYVFATPLAALLALAGTIYYSGFYTCVLKRSTWQNIVIGGGAGAIPPLVGWTAVTGTLSLTALYLFIIVFYWTPPHFWALALIKQKDYARAGVPMLPVVAGEVETRWQIVLYSLLLVVITLMLPALEAMGLIYLLLALILGAVFMHYAWRVWREGGQAPTWGLYKYSLLYLALLFGAMVLDRAILG